MKILPVDCHYVEPEFAASFLLKHEQKGMFIECNTTLAIPYLKAAALENGLSPEQIEGLIITHVHLDHAGGAGAFLKTFPRAFVYAHPKAARHLIDPSKLIASATMVYGEKRMQEWYGTIYPCDPARVVVLEDGASVSFENVKLSTKHLRGHANHHLVITEPLTRTLFTGDTFGVAYPKLAHLQNVILASTSPTDFDGEAAIASLEWIIAEHPAQIALTHYGLVPSTRIPVLAQILRDQLHYAMKLCEQVKTEQLTVDVVEARLKDFLIFYFSERGVTFSADDLRLLAIDIKVNAQGIHYAANKPSIK